MSHLYKLKQRMETEILKQREAMIQRIEFKYINRFNKLMSQKAMVIKETSKQYDILLDNIRNSRNLMHTQFNNDIVSRVDASDSNVNNEENQNEASFDYNGEVICISDSYDEDTQSENEATETTTVTVDDLWQKIKTLKHTIKKTNTMKPPQNNKWRPWEKEILQKEALKGKAMNEVSCILAIELQKRGRYNKPWRTTRSCKDKYCKMKRKKEKEKEQKAKQKEGVICGNNKSKAITKEILRNKRKLKRASSDCEGNILHPTPFRGNKSIYNGRHRVNPNPTKKRKLNDLS